MEQTSRRSLRKFSSDESSEENSSLQEESATEISPREGYVSQDTLLSVLPILSSFLPQEALQYLHSSSSNINQALVETERDPGFWFKKIESEFGVTIPEFSSLQERGGSIWKRNDWKQVYYEILNAEYPLRSDNPDVVEIMLTNPKYLDNYSYEDMWNAAKKGKVETLKLLLSTLNFDMEYKEMAFDEAVEGGQVETAKILLREEGINILGEDGILENMVEKGYPEFVQLIFDMFPGEVSEIEQQKLLKDAERKVKYRIKREEELLARKQKRKKEEALLERKKQLKTEKKRIKDEIKKIDRELRDVYGNKKGKANKDKR